MSQNIIRTTGHHAFKYDPPQFNESGAPCFSQVKTNPDGTEKFPYIGNGFYFWDNNVERARIWGKTRYQGKYRIMECPLTLQGDNFLDLVGCREDLCSFNLILNKLKEHNSDVTTMGKAIYRLQLMAHYRPNAFPFTIIRVLDASKGRERINFSTSTKSKMLLNPEIIICFFDKKDIPLRNARVYA